VQDILPAIVDITYLPVVQELRLNGYDHIATSANHDIVPAMP
jgi:hypothetical protein